MDLLGVSGQELAEVLNVEKTSISKWRNGSRAFGVDSEYFAKFAEYLVKKDLESGNNLLEGFFSHTYPGEEKNLERCVRKFIENKSVTPVAKLVMDDAKNRLYHTQISVYHGAEGRRNAISMLLDVTEALKEPTKIFFLERAQYFGGNLYAEDVREFVERIEKILDKGHTLAHVMFVDRRNSPAYKSLIWGMLPLAFHKNIVHYMMSEKRRENFWMNMYVIPDKLLVTGYSPTGAASDDMLSCIYGDPLLISRHCKLIENFTRTTSPVSIEQKEKDRISLVKIIQNDTRVREPIYFAGRSLSSTTMSEELLEEILDDNNVSKANRKRGYELYHAFRANIESSSMEHHGGYFFSVDEIVKPLLRNGAISINMSALTGQRICLTREQYAQHLIDTAELLLEDPRYRVVLSNNSGIFSENSWFKRNTWNVTFDTDARSGEGKVLFGENVPFINIFTSSYDEIRQRTSPEHIDNEQVAQILRKIAEG